MAYPTLAEPDQVIEWAQTSMWESEGPRHSSGPPGAWLRAWPSGHVHYSRDWCSRLDAAAARRQRPARHARRQHALPSRSEAGRRGRTA